MWARRLGVPHLWPSRVKVFFLAILTSVFNFSVFQYLHNANVAYLNLASPSSNEIVCKLPREECASNPDPARCTVDLEEDQFPQFQLKVPLQHTGPSKNLVKCFMAVPSEAPPWAPWVKSLRRLRVLLSEESDIARGLLDATGSRAQDGFVSSDEPEIEIPDRELSNHDSLREKQLKLALAELLESSESQERQEVGLLAESALDLVRVYEKQSRCAQLGSDASDAAKAEQCRAMDAQKAALLAARMALKDREWALVEAKHRAQQLEEERLQQDCRIRALQTALDKAVSSRTEAEKRHLEAYSTADAEAAEQRGELRRRLSAAEVARDQAMADLAAVEERIEEVRRLADRREEDLLAQLAAREAELEELRNKPGNGTGYPSEAPPDLPSEAQEPAIPRKKPSFHLQGMPTGGLTEESHIQGVGMVMATPRLHYDPRPVPAPPKSGPADTRQAKKSASAAMPMDLKSLGKLLSGGGMLGKPQSLASPSGHVRGFGKPPHRERGVSAFPALERCALQDLALLAEDQRPFILSIPNMKYATPCLWDCLTCVRGRRQTRRIWSQNRCTLALLVMLWSLFQAVAFMVVMYPFSLLVCVYAPVKMSRIMVFLSSILCAMWAVVFVVFTSLVDTHAYAVLWGVSEPGSDTSCLCLCEFPLSRPVVLRIVVLGIGVCWHSINLTLRALKGLRRAQWANMFSVLYSVPVEAFPVVWERPQEAGGGPVKWRTEGEAMQSEPAFDPFCLMDEQPESAWTRAIIAPVPVKDDSRLSVWEPYLGTLDMEIGWCGFPRPVGGAWERDTDCETDSLKTKEEVDSAVQEVGSTSSCRSDQSCQNGTPQGIWSRKVKKRPPPMLFLHTEVEEDEEDEEMAAAGDAFQGLQDWDVDLGINGSRPASASNTFHRRLSDAQDIFHMGGLADPRPPTPASGASGPPSASASRQPTPTEQSQRSAPSIVGRRLLTPVGHASAPETCNASARR
ncbi:unnamed protein product [Symbiodinium natans]|uniref:Uncharacterized protein n=1 Tax=Symbiodinium natans TaxID=878477 RepID=A0A812TCZ2_9DINO|nr:unnamed protein product [Symbiodinium natans]